MPRRNPFGWNYPAGAENDPNAPWNQVTPPCEVCGEDVDDCECPPCPVCGCNGCPDHLQGDPFKNDPIT